MHILNRLQKRAGLFGIVCLFVAVPVTIIIQKAGMENTSYRLMCVAIIIYFASNIYAINHKQRVYFPPHDFSTKSASSSLITFWVVMLYLIGAVAFVAIWRGSPNA
jgi:hypothetical protein